MQRGEQASHFARERSLEGQVSVDPLLSQILLSRWIRNLDFPGCLLVPGQ